MEYCVDEILFGAGLAACYFNRGGIRCMRLYYNNQWRDCVDKILLGEGLGT